MLKIFYLYGYILFQIFSHYSLLQDTEYSSLCCKVRLCCLFILYRSSFVSANPKFLIYPSPICRFYTYTGGSVVKNPPVMQETQVRSLGQEDPLEEEMATVSSVLAWRTPWKKESGGLQSMGSRRVRHA